MGDLITTDRQSLEKSALVTLYEIDCTRWGMGVLRFCSQLDKDGKNVKHNGYEYVALPIEADGFERSGSGTLPSPTLRFATQDIAIRSLILQTNNLVGAPFKRIRIYADNLDGAIDEDPEAILQPDYFTISRKSNSNKSEVEFELETDLDKEGLEVPRGQCLKTCSNIYRVWDEKEQKFNYDNATCPYADTTRFYTAGGHWSFTPEQDECGKRLSDCKMRHPNQPLPFTGMPGVKKY